MIQQFVQLLLDGVDGSAVKEQMRYAFVDEARVANKEQRTVASLHAMMTDVRAAVMARGVRSPSYDPSALMALSANEPDIAAFLAAPVKLQCEIQRHHASKPSWSAAAAMFSKRCPNTAASYSYATGRAAGDALRRRLRQTSSG